MSTETENSEPLVIPFSSWSTVEDDRLEVPKAFIEGAPDWANVALGDVRLWLRFWGLETFREHPAALKLIEMGMDVPLPVETEALNNLRLQAKAQYASKRDYAALSRLERELFEREQYFMEHVDTVEFQRRYGVWTHAQRYKWIAEQTRGAMGVHQVRAILEEVSLVLGELVDLSEAEVKVKATEKEWRVLVIEALKEVA